MQNRDQRAEMLLGAALNDRALFSELMSRFKGEVFGRDEYDLAVKVLQEYYGAFGKVPSAGDLAVWADPKDLAQLPPLEELFRDPGVDPGTARRALYASYQKRATVALVVDIENKIEARAFDVKETFMAMKDMVVRTSEPDRTFMMLTAENAAAEYLAARDWRVSGVSPLCLRGITKAAAGGIAMRELLIFVAPPNRGKTTYLINELYQGLLNGERVLFLSMENEKESVISRLDDRVLLMPKYEQRRRSEECAAWVTKFHRLVPEPAIMYKPAGSYSVQDLDVWLEEQELKTGLRFDRVIVDYIDKFKKAKASRTSDEWDDVRRLADDLRALAIARDLRIITAAQTNRSGIVNREGGQTETVHEGMMAGGFGKFETADIVLGYSETPAEKMRGSGRVGVLKMRDAGGRGREFVVNMAPWIGLMTDRTEEVLPPERQSLLENPDRAYGDLKGLEVKAAPKKGRGAPKVADVSGGRPDGPAKSDGGINI